MPKKLLLGSKWHKHLAVLKCKELAPHLPETRRYSKTALWNMLEHFPAVIIKPSRGSLGKGITKISRDSEGFYVVSAGKHRNHFENKYELERYLRKNQRNRKLYLIQQYIDLADANGGLIDFRYMIQREVGSKEWEITYQFAKIAQKGNITTNVVGGAKRYMVRDALEKSSVQTLNIESILSEMNRVTNDFTHCLTASYPEHTIWGFDLGVDKSGQVWVIEANSRPVLHGLADFSPQMFQRIKHYLLFNEKAGFATSRRYTETVLRKQGLIG